MDVLGTPTAEQWPKMVSMPDYTHWLVLRRTDSYVVGRVFFFLMFQHPLYNVSVVCGTRRYFAGVSFV